MPRKNAQAGPLSMTEIAELYPRGEWIAMKITGTDERHECRGIVLGHSRSRKRVSEALMRAHDDDPDSLLTVFTAGTRVATGDDLRKALAEFAKTGDYVNARW